MRDGSWRIATSSGHCRIYMCQSPILPGETFFRSSRRSDHAPISYCRSCAERFAYEYHRMDLLTVPPPIGVPPLANPNPEMRPNDDTETVF